MSYGEQLDIACQTIADIRAVALEMQRSGLDNRGVQRWSTILLQLTARYAYLSGTGKLPPNAIRRAVTPIGARGGLLTAPASPAQSVWD